MAFYGENGVLVTQGDQELRTFSSCLGIVSETAGLLFEDPKKADNLRRICVALSGKTAMLFMFTPFDPIDTEPRDMALSDMDVLADISDEHKEVIERDLFEYGLIEHSFSELEARFMVSALRFCVQCPTIDTEDEHRVMQAELILEQLS